MESTTINKDINAIKEVRELFNELKSTLSLEETKRIRKELYKKEAVYNFLKEKDSLTNKQKNVLKNISKYITKLKIDLEKLQKYQGNITYGIDYLLNELNEEYYYEPKKIKCAFDSSYIYYMKAKETKMFN